MAYKKSMEEKMSVPAEIKIKKTGKSFADIPEGATMLIATPAIVNEYVKNIPEGRQTTLQQMRKDLAAACNAEYTCPVTAGIFLRIVAENAYEEWQKGKPVEDIAPFWRIIPVKSPTAKKLSFGTDFFMEQRKKEGLA